MTFDEMLAQIIDLLKRQGRVSYGALKRRFDLDDDYLNDLKNEILYVHPVIDDEGRGLIWAGDTASGQAVAPQLTHTTQPPAVQEQPSSQVELLSTAPSPPPDAERRQLTVMFCDLVDSTRLSSQLDPEDWRDVVREYQRVCTDVIQRYDGHIAQLLGDGLLVYFGYPQAHEDDAQRAVRTGLGILDAMGHLNKGLQQAKGVQLALRLGIHTGLVVVGEMGGAGRQEQLALGEVPNIASRIEGLAAPNTIAVSKATYRLIQGYFECQDLGAQTLRGVAEPVHVYRVLQASGARGRLDVAVTRGLTPLVGRESEVTLLQERWQQAKSGQGQVVLLSGDAGIGKSRLVQMLKEHVANEPHMLWECRSLSYFENTALFPLTDLFQRLLQLEAEDSPDEKFGKLEYALSQYRLPLEETVSLFAPLLSLPIPEDRYPLLNLSPQRQRQKTLETIVAILLELAERQSVLFILEDLHWTDPTTLALLNLLMDQTPTASLFVLLTCRPYFQPSWHHRSYLTEMTLNHLSHTQVAQIVTGMTDGKTFPAEVLQQIIEKTDGIPLFVEEITKTILESGQLTAANGHYELAGSLSTLTIPATLQDSLMARLDRLVTAKAVAQYAAVIGRQFPYDLLLAVSQLDEATLQRELGRLVEAEIVYQRGLPPQATYVFKHALIQDAAYQSLLKSTRQQYHQRIAQVLEAQFPEIVTTEPELLAHHYAEAGLLAQALPYWQQAGQRASERSAHLEAIAHLTKGLEVLTTLPDTPERAWHELELQIALGPALMAIQGWGSPAVEQAYSRARALCRQVGDTPQLFPVLWGLWGWYQMRGALGMAQGVGEQLLALAQGTHDRALLLLAHNVLGDNAIWLGEFAAARAHMEQGLACYDAQQHHPLAVRYGGFDPGLHSRYHAAFALWALGYPDQALERSQDALTLARALAHPQSWASAAAHVAMFHSLRREWQAAQELAEAGMALAREQGFPLWLAWGTIQWGWALAEQGHIEAGIAQMRQGLAAWRATGTELIRPYFLGLLAEAYQKGGQTAAGLGAIDEALALVQQHQETFCEAELYRLKGELLLSLSAGHAAEAEACFHSALDIARRQSANSWELRTTMSLARLWQWQGKRTEARELLAPVYGWFTEGFDTADLQEAKVLLDALASRGAGGHALAPPQY
jgi:TOMM system kinase/cyclase fusion protein